MSKVKIIDKKSEKSIRVERDILSMLHHPFIVNMAYAFQDFDNLYLVMDLLTGGDLRYHIGKNKVFSERQSRFFIASLLLGLEYIHSKNIIHRDIKPENLVLDENGYVHITDFGIAKEVRGDNHKETSGTPGYMAPEVLCGKTHSFPVDFFVIGVMVYEFMLGERPYHGRSRKEVKLQILKSQARITEDMLPKGWSRQSADFANKLLRRKGCNRLGAKKGICELKEHPWFCGFDWESLGNKTMIAPFLPPKEANYNKKYCEEIEKISPETEERYKMYVNSQNYPNCFLGYTYYGEYGQYNSHTTEQFNLSTNNSTNNINLTRKNYNVKNNSTTKILKKSKTSIFTIKKQDTSNNSINNYNSSRRESFYNGMYNQKRKLSSVNSINLSNNSSQIQKRLEASQSCKVLHVNLSGVNSNNNAYNFKNFSNSKKKFFLPFLNIINPKGAGHNSSTNLIQINRSNGTNRIVINSLKKNKIIYPITPSSHRNYEANAIKNKLFG